ncbi:hypothetical protein BVI434_2920004 [Burkholderia vietnamiensis]|nr:hypothetical protein BVI434_2920004 [Burkholderia vietnamiensis]
MIQPFILPKVFRPASVRQMTHSIANLGQIIQGYRLAAVSGMGAIDAM